MSTTRIFSRKELTKFYELPFEGHNGARVIEDQIISNSRWSEHHKLIFQLPDQPENEAWRVEYSVGLTEYQDESPWENEESITAKLVQRKQVLVSKWVLA